jgi:hypothetical protein
MADIFQNLYGGLDPRQNESTINVEDFMPKDPEIDSLTKSIQREEEIRNAATENVRKYQEALKFDPVESASKRYKDKYKWKGASPLRKLGTVGFGVMDFLSNFDQKGGIAGEIKRQEQQKFDNLQKTVPQQINSERITGTNAADLAQKYEKERTARDKNNATIAFKKLLESTKDANQKERLLQGWAKLENEGEITTARVREMAARTKLFGSQAANVQKQSENPQNIFEFSNMGSNGKLAPGAVDLYKDLKKSEQRAPRPFSPRIERDPTTTNFSFDPISGKFEMKKITPRNIFDPNTGSLTPMAGQVPAISKEYTNETEVRQINDMQSAYSMLDQATATALDDLRSGKIQDYSGINDTGIIRQFNALLESVPERAFMRSTGQVMSSFATLNHIKAVYGGRAPQALAEDLALIVEGRGASGIQKASALMAQKYATEMYLHAKAGDVRAEQYFSDPNFYQYLKGRSSWLLKQAKNKERNIKQPTLPELIKDFDVYNRGRDTGKNSQEVRPGDPQVSNPLYKDMLRKSGNIK